MSASKCRIIGIICLALSVVLLIVFGVSAFTARAGSAERFLAKYEKNCREGNREKLAAMYDKDLGVLPADVVIPYEGYETDFIFENLRDEGNNYYTIFYVISYDIKQEKTKDGVTTTVKVPFSYPGNELPVKKTFFGYKIIE